ncbi:hypothetical protein K2173_000967 [Erythroxylum novogranatense]|uniref:Uncharacterized protein n=1 Tax=Erythroxylum novogranatense TaxID=1862640 RepID=A0AAV8TQE1_9ROSI|nr:hypothetical protein K2173_000967 [Erythroxylum novogranatense]
MMNISSEAVMVPVHEVRLLDFVLQDSGLCTDNVAFLEALTEKLCTYAKHEKAHLVVVILANVAEFGIIALGIMSRGGVYSGANPAAHESQIKKQVEAAEVERNYQTSINGDSKELLQEKTWFSMQQQVVLHQRGRGFFFFRSKTQRSAQEPSWHRNQTGSFPNGIGPEIA